MVSKVEYRKIKIAMIANNLEINGISSVIMNYCSYIDLQKFDITLLVGEGVANVHREKCNNLGIEIIELPSRKKSTLQYVKALNKVMRRQVYDIVHVHGNQTSIAIELLIAKLHGTKVRIAHSHNTTCMSKKLNTLMKPLFKVVYTNGFACGELAGKWLFGNDDFQVIPNGFITNKFEFNQKYRDEIRKKLNIENKYVLGHIGRINDQKNQKYLLKIFEEVAKKSNDTVLLMVGIGPMLNEIKSQVEKHPYKNRIILFGETSMPEKMYMAMDLFVFPSKYEGLPVTLLEAQISGLPCIVSDIITREVNLGNICWMSIKEEPVVWMKEILKEKYKNKRKEVGNNDEKIKKYDIRNSVKLLESKYEKLFKKRGNRFE